MSRVRKASVKAKDVKEYYPLNLLSEVLEGTEGYTMWDFSVGDFLTEIDYLESKIHRVLELRYQYGMTLEDAGFQLGYTRERVRQLQALGVSKLRRRLMSGACKVVKQNEYTVLLHKYNDLCERYNTLVKDMPKSDDTMPLLVKHCTDRVESLDFSVRTRNCLLRANLITLSDVINFDKDPDKNWAVSLVLTSCTIRYMQGQATSCILGI